MTRRTTRCVLLAFIGFTLAIGSTVGSVAHFNDHAGSGARAADVLRPLTSEPPQKARDLLQTIRERRGEAPPGYVGGRTFHNRERRLPNGRYREYDVNPKLNGRSRDGERIVIEQQSGKAYYTADHYRTFIPLE